MSEEHTNLRRRVLNWILGTSVGALAASVLYPVARFLEPPEIPEATTTELEAALTNDPELLEKRFKILRFGQEPLILIHVGDEDYRCFTATCTHLDCIVTFREEKELIWCWCHNGVYDLHGQNIAGPPPRPLTHFDVNLVDRGAGQPKMIVVSRA